MTERAMLSWSVKQTGRAHLYLPRRKDWGNVYCSDDRRCLDDARLLYATEGCSAIVLVIVGAYPPGGGAYGWSWAPPATWVHR